MRCLFAYENLHDLNIKLFIMSPVVDARSGAATVCPLLIRESDSGVLLW